MQGDTLPDDEERNGYWYSFHSFLLFPVGWALRAGYPLHANDAYKEHCRRVVNGVRSAAFTAFYAYFCIFKFNRAPPACAKICPYPTVKRRTRNPGALCTRR